MLLWIAPILARASWSILRRHQHLRLLRPAPTDPMGTVLHIVTGILSLARFPPILMSRSRVCPITTPLFLNPRCTPTTLNRDRSILIASILVAYPNFIFPLLMALILNCGFLHARITSRCTMFLLRCGSGSRVTTVLDRLHAGFSL